MRELIAAHEEGRIDGAEAERLVGYVQLAQLGAVPDRMDRRRRARLRELGISTERDETETYAWQLSQRVRAGGLAPEEAELLLGRFVLDRSQGL